jgi:hypothetical protein
MAAKVLPIVINKGGQKEILGEDLTTCLWNNKKECLTTTLKLIKNQAKREALVELAYQRSLLFSKDRFKTILLRMVK